MARGQGSLSDAEAEVLAIEHQLREYAREKQEHEASRALHTKLMSQRQHAIRKLAERISTLRASKCAIAAN